jgi:hypothetical protein
MTTTAICRVPLLVVAAVGLACGSDKVAGPAPGSTAQIEVRYASSDVSAAVQSAVAIAADRWSRALSKDMGEFRLSLAAGQCFAGQPQVSETHRNLLLFITITDVDDRGGVLAYTQICGVSSRDTLPILSHIRLDRADLDSMQVRDELQGVIMHEMGHALGFNPKSYMPKGLGRGGTDDPIFAGAVARAEFAKHGAWYTGPTVPLEDASGLGPTDPHWRFIVFGDELMSPAVGRGFKSPLSTITLGYFKDLGYDVDFSVADPYEVIPFFGGQLIPEDNLRNDFVQLVRPTFVSPIVRP